MFRGTPPCRRAPVTHLLVSQSLFAGSFRDDDAASVDTCPVTLAEYRSIMQPTARINHNLFAVEAEHRVDAMVELATPEASGHEQRPALKLAW